MANIPVPVLPYICTLELAQVTFPDFKSYSLDYLSKSLPSKSIESLSILVKRTLQNMTQRSPTNFTKKF